MKINLNTFKNEVYEKLSKEELNELFYWSLFDPSFSEEMSKKFKISTSQRKSFVLSKLRVSATIKTECDKGRKETNLFYEQFTYGELLTNYILAIAIEKELENRKIKGYKHFDIEKQEFPDLIFRKNKKGTGSIYIEIKGIIGTSNLKDRIEKEIKPNLKKGRRKYNNFLLLLLFPCKNKEAERVGQLIQGYYIYEKIIGSNSKNHRKVLAKCISKSGAENYCLDKLVDRILNNGYFL